MSLDDIFNHNKLWDVHLEGAGPKETDLKGAKNLSIEQLSKMETLYKVELDESFRALLKEK